MQTAAQPVKQKSKLRARSLIVALLVGGFLFMISLFIKHHASGRWHDGWPAYFCFLLAVSIVPTVFCFNIAARRINWRAFTLAYLFITLISQFWESSLGVPYQWWGYQPEAMMGIRFPAYCGMPIEASLVWVASAWTSIIIYETLVEWFDQKLRYRDIFPLRGPSNESS